MSILLIGASGRTGRLVAQKLHETAIAFRPMVRRVEQGEAFSRLGARPVIADLAGDFSHAFAGASTVIYAAGSAETEGADQERLIDRDAVIKSADYARQHGVGLLVVISALLASEPECSPEALRHYAQMKRESDDYVIASGLDYLVLRPGELTMERGVGIIQIVSDADARRVPVAREDVAEVVVEALRVKLANRVIGFVGGGVQIRDALSML
jgi:uncharacterized protein YbjT (DUF2867 family)